MKLSVTLLLTFSSALAFEEIDWSRVKPIEEFPVFKDALVANLPSIGENQSINSPRIVNGRIGREFPRQFPYQAAVIARFNFGDGLCGGSIITKRTVLTAAHW